MKMLTFSNRCAKEILRDPINLFFGIGFPVALLLLLSAIQANIPVELFQIEKLTPGISVFGLSFMTLFSATLIARDRETAFLQRLYTTPLRAHDYIFGYALPIIPFAISQCSICYLVAIIIGLPVTPNIILAIMTNIPVSLLYIAIGLLCGSCLNVKQVGGICGALLTNLSAWVSGIWFDLELVGGIFSKIATLLPFMHAVESQKAVLTGNLPVLLTHLPIVMIYTAILLCLATVLFLKQMKTQ